MNLMKFIKTQKFLFLLSLALVWTNCKSDDGSSQDPVDFIIIAKNNLHGNGSEGLVSQNIIVRNTDEWNALIEQMESVNEQSDQFSETDIDFNQSLLVAVFDELRPTGGYSLDLKLKQSDSKIVVEIHKNKPEGMAITVITQPYIIVKIDKTDLPISFQ
jgi:hypothetical protein